MFLSVRSFNTSGGTALKLWQIGGEEPHFIKAPFSPYYYSRIPLNSGIEIPDNPKLNQKIRSYASVTNLQTDLFRVIEPDFEDREDSGVKMEITTVT